MTGIRSLDRMLGSISGVETAHIPKVLPLEPSLPVPRVSRPMPEMKKIGGDISTVSLTHCFTFRRATPGLSPILTKRSVTFASAPHSELPQSSRASVSCRPTVAHGQSTHGPVVETS